MAFVQVPTQRKVSSERVGLVGGGLNRCWPACCLTSLQTLIDAFSDSHICRLSKEQQFLLRLFLQSQSYINVL